MATYEEAGVNIQLGDKCSMMAYDAARNTFPARQGRVGEAVEDVGGFTGAIDMGDYYLLQNADGVGTKIQIAERTNKFETLGHDLLAMVADDAVCVGAETISITNTIDVNQLEEGKIAGMMAGLENICLEQKVVIAGGEIAELGNMLNGYVWNATALAIVEKERMITCAGLEEGDKIIGLKSAGLRANGFSLVRMILEEKFGLNWHEEKYDPEMTWGDVTLTPAVVYSNAVLEMHGRYKETPRVDLKAIAHVTGGGIPGNVERILKKAGVGAHINNLPEAHEVMKKLMEMGDVSVEEAYKTWNMGVGMILVSNDVEKIEEICEKNGVGCQVIGEVVGSGLKMEY